MFRYLSSDVQDRYYGETSTITRLETSADVWRGTRFADANLVQLITSTLIFACSRQSNIPRLATYYV
ncbi:hypothetical protein AFLA_013843 [Aspergillus flavus NRRL3357]|nr:hypothetical protein AFLA_013843 [Aspergillus flavus NRRL3357]